MEYLLIWVLVAISMDVGSGGIVPVSHVTSAYVSELACEGDVEFLLARFPTDTYECQGVRFRVGRK